MQTHSLNEVLGGLENIPQMRGCVGVILDSIQDPANFGAILRSAAFFGVKFVIYGKNRQAPVTSVVVRTSAGGIFEVKMIPVTNISRAIDTLKENGIWTLGTAIEESTPLADVKNDRPFAVVLGNEGKGIRQEVLRHCDMRAKIPTSQSLVDSLNVSVSAGVVLSHLPFSEGEAE